MTIHVSDFFKSIRQKPMIDTSKKLQNNITQSVDKLRRKVERTII